MGGSVLFLGAVAKPCLLSLAGLAFLAGALAICSPQRFAKVAMFGNRWIDTASFLRIPSDSRLRVLDRWIDCDRYAMPYARLIGLVVCAGASLLAYVCLRFV